MSGEDGTFEVAIIEARDVMEATDPMTSRIMVTCGFEKQEVSTVPLDFVEAPAWSEAFSFDTTHPECELLFTVVELLIDRTRRFLGRLIIRVKLALLEDGEPIDHWYSLREKPDGEPVTGELRLRLRYTANKQRVAVDDFDQLCVLGRGGFGKVCQVRKKDSRRIYAMKILRKDMLVEQGEVEGTFAEKEVLRKLNHPFIVGLKYSFQTPEKLYLVLDYVSGGELFYHLKREKRFSEDRARFYAAELVLALEHLHHCDIIYRDLKPENVLLESSGHVCLTDFGLCKEGVGSGKTHTFCGTAEYLAPEVLQGAGYDAGVDWWSLGTLIYEMLTGRPPFFSNNIHEMYRKILNDKLTFPNYVSMDTQSLLSMLLERSVEDRLGSGISDAEEIKAHPFFREIQWGAMLSRDVEPPVKPSVANSRDTSNFDTNFTGQSITETPVEYQLGASQQGQFAGFSYTAPTEMDGFQDQDSSFQYEEDSDDYEDDYYDDMDGY